tara:strand:+ start:250 stop:1173 length:924 start_codon:yes stop_codon:yes gene_type:complete
MTNKVFSLLNYIGHKSKILDQILIHFPSTLNGVFWDVFSGSCVVGLSTPYKNVNFVDTNKYLQALYKNLNNVKFIKTLEEMIKNYNLTNSYRKPRSEYLKDPSIGTCKWHGETIKNLHLDQLNKTGYNKLLSDFNNGKFSGLKESCAYMILTLYGRNSNVTLKKDGKLSGGIGPLDFSPKAKKKYDDHLNIMSGRQLTWTVGTFKDINPTKDDFVYMDPPYLASGFKYGGWSETDENDLLDWIDSLPCNWALSNVFTSGDTKNNLLRNWSKKHKTIKIQKNYRKWAAKGKSTAKRKTKTNEEVLILP